MSITSDRDLEADQRARGLIVPIHLLIDALPAAEKYGLCDQMRRASKSVFEVCLKPSEG